MKSHISNCKDEHYKNDYKTCPKLYEEIMKYGLKNFSIYKIFESEDKIEISRMESKMIRTNMNNELIYNNVMGASGRRVLYEEDVYFIRELYKRKYLHIDEAYEIYYKDVVTHKAFKKAWHGDTFKNIHYDVYTKENKEWHFAKGQSRPGEKNRASKYTEKEVILIRKRRDMGEKLNDVWEDYKGRSHKNSFLAIWNNKNWTYLLN